MSDESVLAAYRKMNRELDRITDERRALSRRKTTLDEETSYFSQINYEVQERLYHLGSPSDEWWHQAVSSNTQNLRYLQQESFSVAQREFEPMEEKERELNHKEDSAHRAYEKEKVRNIQEQDSKRP